MDLVQSTVFAFKVVGYDANDAVAALPAQPAVTVDANGSILAQPDATGAGGQLTVGDVPASPGGSLIATVGALTSPPFTFDVVVPPIARVAVEAA